MKALEILGLLSRLFSRPRGQTTLPVCDVEKEIGLVGTNVSESVPITVLKPSAPPLVVSINPAMVAAKKVQYMTRSGQFRSARVVARNGDTGILALRRRKHTHGPIFRRTVEQLI